MVAYGSDRENRVLLPEDVVKNIKAQPMLNSSHRVEKGMINWELTLIIPFNVLHYHKLTSLKGKSCYANFYKCGDDLPEPHFLAWNNIRSSSPNFHLPEFFGIMEFV